MIAKGSINFLPTHGSWWEWGNVTSDVVLELLLPVVINVVTLVGNFFLFKSVSIGLNVLLDISFALISNAEETENE